MRVGSLVEYIGGQDRAAKMICPLELNTPYVVTFISEGIYYSSERGRFTDTTIHLDTKPQYIGFHPCILRELQPPTEISIDELIEEPLNI